MIEKFGRVGLLYGGTSSEREVSLMSGEAIYQALQNLGVDVVAIDAGENLLQALPSYQLDRVFIALHGEGGEDGTLQVHWNISIFPTPAAAFWPRLWRWINCAASRCGRAWVCQPLILLCCTPIRIGRQFFNDWVAQ